jgi:DNA-binding LacI/PurR family transcriptional regulator
MNANAKKPTIRDVAQQAGVGVSTVSKYLTGRPYVSEETGARVQAAIELLDFQPNGLGRALATGRSKVIGVVIASLSNPFYLELVEAADREASRAGFSIFLASTDRDPARERHVMAAMLDKGVDGFLLAHVASTDRRLLQQAMRGKAYVLASRHFEDAADDYVVIDGAKGSRLAVDHLVELGHRRLACVLGPATVRQFRWRRDGFLEGLRAHGLELDPDLLVEAQTRNWLDLGRAAADQLLALGPDRRPTAVHTANDLVALGILQRARELGVRVPDELSVVGFDNVLFGGLALVPLTTVDSRIEEVGARATRVLLDRIDGRAGTQPTRVVLEPSLVVRGSTAPPPSTTSGDS